MALACKLTGELSDMCNLQRQLSNELCICEIRFPRSHQVQIQVLLLVSLTVSVPSWHTSEHFLNNFEHVCVKEWHIQKVLS